MKRDSLDAVVSDLVRERDDWECVNCGLQFPNRKGRDVHCSHFYSRKYNSTRYFLDNLVTLCAACHDKAGKQPDFHVSLIRRVLGDVRYQDLQFRKMKLYRYRKEDKKAMTEYYRDQLKRLKEQRRNGAQGILMVASYD